MALHESMEQTGAPLQLSATSLELYRDCPRKYYFARVLGLPEADSEYFAFGEALHGVLERFNRARMVGEVRTWPELAADWAELLDRARFPSRFVFESYRARGELFLQRYCSWALERDERVLGVEKEFAVPYVDRMGRVHSLRGRVDLMLQRPRGVEIVDYKSGHRGGMTRVNKRPTGRSESDPQRKLQLGLYYLACFGDEPAPGARVTYIFLRHPEDRGSGPCVEAFNQKEEQVISTEHTAESLQGIRTMVDDVIDGILAHHFPCKPDLWKCRQCAYQANCDMTPE